MLPPRARVSGSWRSVAHLVQPFHVGSTVQIVSRASQPGRAASCSSRNFERARLRFAVLGETRRSGVLRWIGPERFMIPPSSVGTRSTATTRTSTRSRERRRCCRSRIGRRPRRSRGSQRRKASRRRRCSAIPTRSGRSRGHGSTVRGVGTLPWRTTSGWLRRAGRSIRRTRPGVLGSTRLRATDSGSLPESEPVLR